MTTNGEINMACKLVCPNCNRVLKEHGDHSKKAQGSYIVVPIEDRLIYCMACKFAATVSKFDPDLLLIGDYP